jgi:hypothetical protein
MYNSLDDLVTVHCIYEDGLAGRREISNTFTDYSVNFPLLVVLLDKLNVKGKGKVYLITGHASPEVE